MSENRNYFPNELNFLERIHCFNIDRTFRGVLEPSSIDPILIQFTLCSQWTTRISKIPNTRGGRNARTRIATSCVNSLPIRCTCFVRRPYLSIFRSLSTSTRVSTHRAFNFKAHLQSRSTAREVFVMRVNGNLKIISYPVFNLLVYFNRFESLDFLTRFSVGFNRPFLFQRSWPNCKQAACGTTRKKT